ncbi:C4-dicarboxylate ABC transporter permease [Chromatiales bacterium (ex Bugula neritina AB1)]|nr:C4-dicarboxylate ABC transporter permease [Chromatiales bacterium (ex Bugula neritina AB1)]
MEPALWMFPVLLLLLLIGIPVAYSLFTVSLVFGILRFGDKAIFQFVSKVQDVAGNYILAAVPLFVFMGCMLERAGIAERLFQAFHLWTRKLPGGLAVGSVLLGVVFAAASGVVGATETVIGLLAIPIMLSHGYNKSLISGTICGGGSLGTVIPPSVLVIILAPVADVSVGDLFAGLLFPGLIMAGLFVLYIVVRCAINPSLAPKAIEAGEIGLWEKLRLTFIALIPPVFLIFTVLGSILLGLATPTEAAACGALGTVVLTAINGKLSYTVLSESVMRTLLVTAMILTILLAGNMFAGVFIASGGISATNDLLASANLSPWATLLFILFLAFLAGFALDLVSVILVFIPIALPLIKPLGFDPVWFCILFLVVIQTSYLTPPMAPSIFYLRAISPPEITLPHMYRGVIPFIFLQLATLILVIIFPALALWLPSRLTGF